MDIPRLVPNACRLGLIVVLGVGVVGVSRLATRGVLATAERDPFVDPRQDRCRVLWAKICDANAEMVRIGRQRIDGTASPGLMSLDEQAECVSEDLRVLLRQYVCEGCAPVVPIQ